jgi:hypothetical protein
MITILGKILVCFLFAGHPPVAPHSYRHLSLFVFLQTLTHRTGRAGLFAHPDYQRKGFGRCLVMIDNKMADKAKCWTFVASSPNANNLLQKMGFRTMGVVA